MHPVFGKAGVGVGIEEDVGQVQLEMLASHQRTHRPWWACGPQSFANEK